MTLRIVVADDQALFRSTLTLLINSEKGMRVVAEASGGAEAVRAARNHIPDVIVMDIRMPGIDGLQATKAIVDDPRLSECRILVLTTFEQDEYVMLALRAGASGFVGKDLAPAALLDAIRTVARGDALLSPFATKLLISQFLSRPTVGGGRGSFDVLTPREREAVMLVATGLANSELAEQLGISTLTAKTHVNRAMTKLGVRDRAQLVIAAYQEGLVRPGTDPTIARRSSIT